MMRVALYVFLLLMLCSQAWTLPTSGHPAEKLVRETIGGEDYIIDKAVNVGGGVADVFYGHNAKTQEPIIMKTLILASSYRPDAIEAYKKAGLYIYHEGPIMLQRKLNGITLSKYLLTNMRNGSLRDPYPYYREVQKQVTQQQDRIGYWHGDAHDNNILVDAETGKFISLIDWDTASEKFQWDAT